MTKIMPWYLKIIFKIVFARLPVGYSFWRKLNLFAHGHMHNPKYAFDVFINHYNRCEFGRKGNGFVGLEFGPGDSLLSAMVAKAHGASSYRLIDAGEFATQDLAVYRSMENFLISQNQSVPSLKSVTSISEYLTAYQANYGTNGIESLKEIPDGSVDFIWSQAVLEHVRRDEFLSTMLELRRIIHKDGISSHRVDLKDHLGGALNNMRIGSGLWEKNWMARSGFYTNRIRFTEMCELFKKAGFSVEILSVNRWAILPTQKSLLAKEFQHFSEDELLVKDFDVLLRPI